MRDLITLSLRTVQTLLACTLLITTAVRSDAATLVQDGEAQATVVMDTNPSQNTQDAAKDLVHYIEAISGARLATVDAGTPVQTPVTIYIGLEHEGLADLFPGVDIELTDYDEILIAVRGDKVLLGGRDHKVDPTSPQHGTALAIYTFIEKHLGVRWLWPGELGEDVPQQTTIAFDDMVDAYTPPLQQRNLRLLGFDDFENTYDLESDFPDLFASYRGNHDNALELGAALNEVSYVWRRRQRSDYHWVRALHAFRPWWRRFHESHPEYFALQPDGTRSLVNDPLLSKLCISNPAVADQWLADAVAQLEADPSLRLISVSPNDDGYTGYCVCENCKAWDPQSPSAPRSQKPLKWGDKGPPDPDHVALTDRYARFWNICARKLKERYPDRELYVGAWAYEATRTPPVEVELEDNIIIGFISSLPAYTRERHAEERAIWEGWSRLIDKQVWRPNLFYADRGMPVVFMHRVADDFAWLADHHMLGLDLDIIYGHWALHGLQYYLMAKHAWDPYLDVDAEIDDYTTRAFGPDAGPVMRQYFEKLEALYYVRTETPGFDKLGRITSLPMFYSPEARAELQALLDEATEKAGDDRHRERVAFYQVGHTFLELHLGAIDAMSKLREADDAGRAAAYDAAVEAAKLRDDFLDAQMGNLTLNTIWGFFNWGESRSIDNCFGPPSPAQRER